MKKLITTFVALISTSAFAHHPLNGMPMETFTQGLLSGIGHPILGFDHLFFVLLVGVAALFTGRKYTAPLAYIIFMILGCLLMIAGINLPIKESVIALSLLVLGTIVLSGHGLTLISAMVIFSIFGLFHGSAFGDAIAGQEGIIGGSVLIGYLIGLGVVQYLLLVIGGWMLEKPLAAKTAHHLNARFSGAIVAGAGLFLTLEALEGSALLMLGLR